MISCYLGVTEPAMFGINLKYVYPFVAGMIGSAMAGMFATLMGVRATSIGVGGLPGILSIATILLAVFRRNGDCHYRTNGLNIFSERKAFLIKSIQLMKQQGCYTAKKGNRF